MIAATLPAAWPSVEKTEAIAAGFHRYGARSTEHRWRFEHLVVTPVALTEALDRAL